MELNKQFHQFACYQTIGRLMRKVDKHERRDRKIKWK